MLRNGGEAYWKRKAKAVVERRAKRGSLYDASALESIRKGVKQWEEGVFGEQAKKLPESRSDFQTASGIPLKPLFTPLDVMDADYSDQGYPGIYPYLRGVHPTMYRGGRGR